MFLTFENLFLFLGSLTELDVFKFGTGTGSFYSCSFVQNGQMFIVGGKWSFSRQISKIESCRLTKIGELPVYFSGGACNNFGTSTENEKALLCFSSGDRNGCLR